VSSIFLPIRSILIKKRIAAVRAGGNFRFV
jgi:hypothetical protein